MRKLREVLRLKHERGLSDRKIGSSLTISHVTVAEYLRRAREAGVGWPLPPEWDDARLEEALFPPTLPTTVPRPLPDWDCIYQELGGHKGVTLELLWLEYKQAHPDGFQYSHFCDLYRQWRGQLDVALRHPYRGGEKLFVDYAGVTQPIVDRGTGEIRNAQVFVAVLGASNYTFVDLTWTRSLPDWIASHVRMFAFYGGVAELLVPDNERAGVKTASRYEPDLNPTYHDLATHYGTTVLPARPYSPTDKAKVEAAVQAVERWVLAPLRNHTFFALPEARRGFRPLLQDLNGRPFQKMEGSRRSLFEALDQPALLPLPTTPYEFAEWRKVRVNIDYHVQIHLHYYSVPHPLCRAELDARVSATTVELFHRGKRVAAHARSHRGGGYTTNPDHMPAHHRAHLEWSPSRLIAWARTVGPQTAQFVQRLLDSRPHPEQGYRSCLGLMKLARTHPSPRLEAACHRALAIGSLTFRSVKSILDAGLDQLPVQTEIPLRLPHQHPHLRGPDYYRSHTATQETDHAPAPDLRSPLRAPAPRHENCPPGTAGDA
jgi:transposase